MVKTALRLCLLLYNNHVCYHIAWGYFYCQRWATHYNFGTPGTIFEWITHTHSMLSVAIKLSLLVCNSSEKAELLIFCTEKYELKLDDMSYYILYTFQTPMFTLFCPTVKYVLLFYAETICLGILIILFKKYADALFTLLKVLCFYQSCGVFYMVLSLPCK